MIQNIYHFYSSPSMQENNDSSVNRETNCPSRTKFYLNRAMRIDAMTVKVIGYATFFAMFLFSCGKSFEHRFQEDAMTDASIFGDAQIVSSLFNAVCGNGIVESGEDCDDGNRKGGDTCSSDCLSFNLCPGAILNDDYETFNRNGFDLSYLSGCKQITGDLILYSLPMYSAEDVYAITNIEDLKDITTIDGNLEIMGTQLTNLTGLEQLTFVGGDLAISGNTALKDLKGLESLTEVGGDLIIGSNDLLTSLNYLSQLTRIGGDLLLSLKNCKDLSGLESLQSVGGSIRMNVDPLNDLSALRTLQSVGGEFSVYGTATQELSALSNLLSVGGNILIAENPKLGELFIPNNAFAVDGTIAIEKNVSLPTCEVELFEATLRKNGFSGELWKCENLQDECESQTCPDEDLSERLDPESDFPK